jgi:asparagine synthase (glutamine-hydrolysing)
MCGIAGFLTARGAPADRALLRRMCDRLTHRGPDAYGEYCRGEAALGHRRLSIIDLSGGGQPMGNEDGALQVVFNGEIYNFQPLREELIAKGHRFQTRSDTEVLVHLYEEEGERMPERLNGMFAFAIWDERNQELFLARDRMGKKPLYYSFALPGLRLAFASELKALLEAPGFDRKIDSQALADFLCFSYVPDPASIYQGIAKLEPGSSLRVSRQGHSKRRYWKAEITPDDKLSLEDAVEQIRALAADAVRLRLISDVPLGAFLSGGVDSSAVTGVMSRQGAGRVKTFSIGFDDKRFDELKFARIAAAHNETEHYEEVVMPSVEEMLEKLSGHFDEPFGDSSAIPMLYLSRMTRRHVTVALSGDGADELFGGYRRYRFGVLEERLRAKFPEAFRTTVIRAAGRWYPKFDYLPRVFRAKTLLTNLAQQIGDAYFTTMTAVRDQGLQDLLSPALARDLSGYSPREAYRKRFEAVRHLTPLEQMQSVDFDTYLPGDILVKADRATMAYSLESRSPWLDYRIAELSCRVPAAMKIHRGAGKHVFKEAMAAYVPRPLIERTKMGFSVPLASWFRTSLRPVFEAAVLPEGIGGLLSVAAVQKLWREHQSGISNHDKKLWNLLMLGLWHGKYVNRRTDLAELVEAGK